MFNQKGYFVPITVIAILIMVGTLGFFFIQKQNKQNISSKQTPQIATSSGSIKNTELKTYTDTEGAFTLQYPANWESVEPLVQTRYSKAAFADKKAFGQGIEISIFPDTGNLPEKDFLYTYSFYGQELAEPSMNALGDLMLGVYPTIREANEISGEETFIPTRAGSSGVGYWFHNGSVGIFLHFIESTDRTSDDNTRSQILSSLHITKQLPPDNSPEVILDQGDIVIVKNKKTTKITSYGHNYAPIFSQDRTKIAYLSVPAETLNSKSYSIASNIWIINADGSNPTQVTKYLNSIERGNLYWIDNDRLLFSEGQNSIRVYTMSTKSIQTIWGSDIPTDCESLNQAIGQSVCNFQTNYYFSPDNKSFIAMKSAQFPNYESTIAIINLNNLNVNSITIPTPVHLTNFNPDGKTMNISKFNYNDQDHPAIQTINLW